MPNVAFVVEDVKAALTVYELIRDCLLGQKQVKFRRTKYLPQPNAAVQTEENLQRYNAYIQRALFVNFTKRTLGGLVGQIFQRDPAHTVPTLLEPLVEDATGSGVSLLQLAKLAATNVMGYGRCGLFIDYPETDGASSVAELEEGKVRAWMEVVAPWDGINYRVKSRGAEKVLSLVVFRRDYTKEDDGFETKKGSEWVVLRLTEADEYTIEIYRDKMGATPFKSYMPKDASGAPLDHIPFIFIGSTDNDPAVDEAPLYDIAEVNIAHYRNSADYEESVYMLGQPTPYVAGLTEEWAKKILGGSVTLGARGMIPLPQGATIDVVQVEPNTLSKEAMDQKEAQMLALGAKLIEGSQVQRTATEADIDNTSETSVLSSVAGNVASAFKWALEQAALFVGATGEIAYDMNTEFDLVNLSPQERAQIVAEWQGGLLAWEEARASLRRGGVAYLTDAEAKEKIDAEKQEAIDRQIAEAGGIFDATNPEGGQPPKKDDE